jgi:hypothetical protein
MILIVEDLKTHFEAIQGYLRDMYPGEHDISHVQSADAVEAMIDLCRRQSIPLVLIFDLDMGMDKGWHEHILTNYVAKLWKRSDDEWLARVPIVVWSFYGDTILKLNLPRRARSSVVIKVASTGVGDFEELDMALQEAIA